LKEEIKRFEAKLGQLNNDLQSRTNEMNREIRRKERSEREIKQVKKKFNKNNLRSKED